MGKRELVALLNLSPWCLVMVEWLFLVVPWGFLRFVVVIFPEHTHLLFLTYFLNRLNNSISPKYQVKVVAFFSQLLLELLSLLMTSSLL